MATREAILEAVATDVVFFDKNAKDTHRVLLTCCALRETYPKLGHGQHGDFVLTALDLYNRVRLGFVLVKLMHEHSEYFTDKGLEDLIELVCLGEVERRKVVERLQNLMLLLEDKQ